MSVSWTALLMAVQVMPLYHSYSGLLHLCIMQPVCHASDEGRMGCEGPRFIGISRTWCAKLPSRPPAARSKFREKIPNSENEHGIYRGYVSKGEGMWEGASSQVYLQAEQLLSYADSGSSNSYRVRP